MPNSIMGDYGFNSTDNSPNTATGDPAVWTLLGEAGLDPQGQLAVASTIANRSKLLKTDYSKVVTDPSQGYEAWQDENARQNVQNKYPVGSPEYNQAASILSDLQSGKTAPLPYDSFYSPKAQAAKNRPAPNFEDNKTGVDIGGNRFFNTKNPVSIMGDYGFGEGGPAPEGHDPGVTNSATGAPLPDIQAQAARQLQKSGDLKIDPQTGQPLYKGMPFYQSQGDEQPQRPGDYWMDKTGAVHQVPVDYNGLTNYGNSVMLGFGNKLMAGVQALKATGGNVTNPMFGDFYQQALSHYQGAQQAYQQEHPVASALQQTAGNLQTVIPAMALGGEAVAPVTRALGPVGQFLSGSMTDVNPLVSAASRTAGGAIQGGTAAGLTAAQSDRPFAQQVGEGALTGAIVNPALGKIADVGQNLFNGGSAANVPQSVAELAKLAEDKYGFNLRLGQIKGAAGDRAAGISDSNMVTYNPATAANNAAQKANLTKQYLKFLGSDADHLTPDGSVMDDIKNRIGGVMNDVAGRTNITNVDPLLARLGTIGKAASGLPDSEYNAVLRLIQNVGDTVDKSSISGDSYAGLIRKGSPLDRAANGSSGVRNYAQDIRDALDDAAEAHMTPEDRSAWDQARFQYKSMMAIKNLAAKQNVQGEISPGLLNQAITSAFKGRAFQGAGDPGELGLIANTFLKEPGSSNTTERARDVLMNYTPKALLGAGVGDIAANLLHNPGALLASAAGAIGAAALNKGSNALRVATNLSPEVRNRFLNNALSGGSPAGTALQYVAPTFGVLDRNMFSQEPSQQTK